MQKKVFIIGFLILIVFIIILIKMLENNKREVENPTNSVQKEVKMQRMKVQINETEYEVKLDNNKTVKDILNNLPLKLKLLRYAGHEYYSELPFTPTFDQDRTSDIKAGHIYYWDGWNAFVINYKDYDISPYKVVHIGEILSDNISEILNQSDNTINIIVNN